MATSLASDKLNLTVTGEGIQDPFVTTTVSNNRYASYDEEAFASGPASPRQAKRTLEAHLAETERRLDEAGKLGTALVSQRKALTEQLQEVEKMQTAGDMSPELRQRLAEIEKDYNDLARESTKSFLPKSRVPSNETSSGSPFAPDNISIANSSRSGGRRSASPSKFESQATGSPTKLTVPNRKARNQSSNRVHDIEFAAEISTSLIAQVRNLQAMLAERDEELRDIKVDKSNIEVENEGFQQRLKTLDESENRYKEENWNLETRIQELSAQKKEASAREKKLNLTVNTIKAEKSTVQRDLDEVRVTHARLVDQHAAAVKQHDIELGTLKRNILIAEGERAAMQRRIDDLTSQNHELARAFAMTRGRTVEREATSGMTDDDLEAAADHITPEHSPPQSPMKGTPRHAMLETETMKSSLQHAQRTIQSQRSLLHREKTEKLEMRRIIQDLRDDLEKARNEQPAPLPSRRPRKQPEPKDFKKPPRLLGSFRSSRQEVVLEDEWEDQSEISPRSLKAITNGTVRPSIEDGDRTDTDNFETANEEGESPFETANERNTETDDFQTGNEEFSGSSDDNETETEDMAHGFSRPRQQAAISAGLPRSSNRDSFDSTASTSADEHDYPELRTPTAMLASRRNARRGLSRGAFSRQTSEEPNVHGSPASFVSNRADVSQGGQSLFAELQDFDGSDDDSLGPVSPSRRSIRSMTPGSTRRAYSPPPAMPPLPRVPMVDAGVMTEPIEFHSQYLPMLNTNVEPPSDDERLSVSPVSVVHDKPLSSKSSVISPSDRLPTVTEDESRGLDVGDAYRPMSLYSDAGAQFDPEIEEKLAQFPSPPTAQPILPPPPELSMSAIHGEGVEPCEEVIIPPAPPALSLASIQHESVEPIAEPEVPLPDLSLSAIVAEGLEPVAEPDVPLPDLTLSSIVAEGLEPIAEPEIPLPDLTLSSIVAEGLEPIVEPEIPLPDLTLSSIVAEGLEPIAEPEIPLPDLTLSTIVAEGLEPVAEPEVPLPKLTFTPVLNETIEPTAEHEVAPPSLALSVISTQSIDPIAEPEIKPLIVTSMPPELSMSSIVGEQIEPVAGAEPEVISETKVAALPIVSQAIELSMSSIMGEHVAPVADKQPELGLSTIMGENVAPVAEKQPELGLSAIMGENVAPVAEKQPELGLSTIMGENVAPVVERQPELGFSTIIGENVAPVAEKQPELGLSTIMGEHVAPVAEELPQLSLSTLSTEVVEPVNEPEKEVPVPTLNFIPIHVEQVEPRDEVIPIPTLVLSHIATEDVAPISEEPAAPALALSPIAAESIDPILEPLPTPPTLVLSPIAAEAVQPANPSPQLLTIPSFGFSSIESIETRPITPRSPKRDGFILPREFTSALAGGAMLHESVAFKPTDSSLVRKDNESDTFIAEDDTRQLLRDTPEVKTPEHQRPFREISHNANGHRELEALIPTADQGAQTSLTAGAIDELFKTKSRPSIADFGSPATIGTPGTVRIHRSQESFDTPIRGKGNTYDIESGAIRRPDSAASGKASIQDLPPLPSNHRQVIEAARTGSSQSNHTNMGPPLWPASALKPRPMTPNQSRPISPLPARGAGTSTVRGRHSESVQGRSSSPTKFTARSRQSSVSSFASELDSRFNMRHSQPGMVGFGPNTDPRMIQAITQTMIGEYLWKYTRKAGRGQMSENRHRRYFWVHPYTRTLYWSDRDPSTAGRAELRTKSVSIEAVRVVTDDNPMPPGLHRKSLVIISPGRAIKFTCTTGQRHETWFNALSYLLLRTANDGHVDTEEIVENITRDDVDEFNPPIGRSATNGTRRQATPSVSSYNSRTTRNESPALDMSMNIPTLTPTPKKSSSSSQRPAGTLSKLSGYWKSSQSMPTSFSNRLSRAVSGQDMSVYEASDVHDSAEDLREMIERQDRESDRLENVRACCDGKHDVGTLHNDSGKKTRSTSNPGRSTIPTPKAPSQARS